MEVFNSDNIKYGGSGVLNPGELITTPIKYHNQDYSISITLPPLAITVLKLFKEDSEFELSS
jgi:1,4-alpha-glucan branching enzyme